MAEDKTPVKPAQADGDAQAKAARDAAEKAAAQAQADAAAATEEARRQSLDTLKQQEEMRPEPSQEEADRIKTAAAVGAAPYVTRQAKP